MRGGAARSSDEAPVMGVEPRGSVIRLTNVANPLCGDERQERLDNGSRVNREVSARFCGGAQGEIPWAYSPREVSATTRPHPLPAISPWLEHQQGSALLRQFKRVLQQIPSPFHRVSGIIVRLNCQPVLRHGSVTLLCNVEDLALLNIAPYLRPFWVSVAG